METYVGIAYLLLLTGGFGYLLWLMHIDNKRKIAFDKKWEEIEAALAENKKQAQKIMQGLHKLQKNKHDYDSFGG